MKRYFIYIIMVVAALFVGCTTDVTDGTPEMVEVGDIEVTLSVEGEEVSRLDLSSVSHTIKVDVALNNDNIFWNVTSSEEWCQIVEEPHHGSGSFTIVINANDSFDARETAYITFTAGEYATEILTVAHNGNVFVLDQAYAVSTKSAGSFTTKVKTRNAGEAWSLECDSWIIATKGAATLDENGDTITEVTIAWEENTDVSRYGVVAFVEDGKTTTNTQANIWQYGTDVEYDEEGNLFVEAQDAESLEVRAPAQTVKEVIAPSWVSVEERTNSDNTISYMLLFAGNPSDARIIRSSDISLSMLSGAADVKLPVVKQMYYAVEGIMTGEGFKIFANTWNEGGDVSQWHIDGVPTFMQDIDMTEVEGWVAIGTAERPWTGKFNGNGKKVKGLKASQPLFGVCNEADIEGITFDDACEFVSFEDFGASYHLAALAGDIRATIVSTCTNNGIVKFESSSDASECHVYVAGLVGKADATSTVQLCVNNGPVTVANACDIAAEKGEVYVAGLVAYNAGGVYDGFNNAAVTNNAINCNNWVGGVVGKNEEGATLQSNSNANDVAFKSPRNSVYGYVGGIVGEANGTLVNNTNEGKITAESPTQNIYVGGVVGYVHEGTVLAENSNRTISKISVAGSPTNVYVGGYYGKLDIDSYIVEAAEGTEYGGSLVLGTVASSAKVYLGGVIGCSTGAVTFKNVVRNGDITFELGAAAFTINPLYAGGIVGAAMGGLVTIDTATTNGAILFKANKQVVTGQYAIGGSIGYADSGVVLSNITNNSTLGWDTTGGQKNGAKFFMAGVVAYVDAGDATITNCHNKASIHSWHYNNNGYTNSPNMTGGILGCAGFYNNYSGEVHLSGCSNTAQVTNYRGFVGGIAGYTSNAIIEECNHTASMPFKSATYINTYYAGIVSGADNTTIKSCTVKGDFSGNSYGSCDLHGGAIAAYIKESTVIDGCASFSHIAANGVNTAKNEYLGGLVGQADDTCTIKNSKYGGSVLGTDITVNNFEKFLQGTNANTGEPSEAVVENCSYWDGK